MDSDPTKQPFCPFALPEDEYWDIMFAKRLAPEGTSSPPLLAHQLSGMSIEGGRAPRRYSTVDDTDGMYAHVFSQLVGLSRFSRSTLFASIYHWAEDRPQHSCVQGYANIVTSGSFDGWRKTGE